MNVLTIIGIILLVVGIILMHFGLTGKTEPNKPEFRTDYRGDGMLNISTDDLDIDSIKSVWIYSHKTGQTELIYFETAIKP